MKIRPEINTPEELDEWINSLSDDLQDAADNRKLVTLDYADAKGNRSNRVVEITELKATGAFAYCRLRSNIRQFKFNQIVGYRVTDELFEARDFGKPKTKPDTMETTNGN